jgi:hypothetical protein
MQLVTTTHRTPATNGADWTASRALPKTLPSAAATTPVQIDPYDDVRWARTGRRNATGTTGLVLGSETGTKQLVHGTYREAVAAAARIARAADAYSKWTTVGVVQGRNGYLLLDTATSPNFDDEAPHAFAFAPATGAHATVVKSTDPRILALVSATRWIDFAGR